MPATDGREARKARMKSHTLQTEGEPVFTLITGVALRWNDALHLSHKITIICEKAWTLFQLSLLEKPENSSFSEPQIYAKKH